MTWQIQEAKNKLSEVVDKTLHDGPQVITRRGQKVVVMMSIKDYESILPEQKKLGDFLRDSPLSSELKIKRDKDPTLREVDL
ncbi:MAG: type II toxin-antitoxin system Phd/YefM family antitoxin [Kiritimatiellae bacterium]|jgi:antitoxin Phd|nr:type II toxin-antitoxin system Phd/YefM family antitoxin [Kiritimatiellia bacterium]